MSVAKRNAKRITITQDARSIYKLPFVDLAVTLGCAGERPLENYTNLSVLGVGECLRLPAVHEKNSMPK
jgi:hypothetical protein